MPFVRLRAASGSKGLEVEQTHAPLSPEEEFLEAAEAAQASAQVLPPRASAESSQQGSSPEGSPTDAQDPTVGTQGSSSLASQRTDQVRPLRAP